MATDRPVWTATHVGRVRRANEDLYLVGKQMAAEPVESWSGRMTVDHGWAVIADGMGGHEDGQIASRIVIETIAESIESVRDEANVTSMIENAHRKLYEAMFSGQGRPGMGSTIVGVVFFDQEALVFNVGDSRAYELRRGQLLQLSRDDTLGADRGRKGGHALTQSLGGTATPQPVTPHIRRFRLEDHIGVLLCSDGLTDMVQENRIAALLAGPTINPAEHLATAANDAGGNDNITVVIIGPKATVGPTVRRTRSTP
ncbi:serine/threonine-protein phosphatase [Bradyrhizobium diazoefficiens]|uniref:PP2C family protein-serine/threonine phosphatase n=1 Tax=Bradyrhizobium diazoefficiens TaxID=1355477 RepID=UPI00190D53B7|nr:protein phosphatase 2C domain-containing protein [Bradyrhizobium diazoefficiens]QQO35338.1 serine/threonine-protein phosphatase [Bradyrhizobium diazoefficiens]